MSPPTDSLYKFLFIAGLVLIVYTNYAINSIVDKQNDVQSPLLDGYLIEICTDSLKMADKTYGKNADSMAAIGNRLILALGLYNGLSRSAEIKKAYYEPMVSKLNRLQIAGEVLAALGFCFWLWKIQYYQDEILILEAVAKGLPQDHKKQKEIWIRRAAGYIILGTLLGHSLPLFRKYVKEPIQQHISSPRLVR